MNEAQRKRSEAHFGYWFRYLEQFAERNSPPSPVQPKNRKWPKAALLIFVVAAAAIYCLIPSQQRTYSTDFQQTEDAFLQKEGWLLLSRDAAHWERRAEKPGCLSLFTLAGDNWHSKSQVPRIKNLLAREIKAECFCTEVHFQDFIPNENWQQAGILLLEDTTYEGKSLRLSLAYNDFFGGYDRPGEVIVQTVAGFGKDRTNVEEVHHHTLFSMQTADSAIARNNLQYAGLRIEQRGKGFRFLYAASPFEHFSYKELGIYDFDMKPRYVGVFALKGFVDSAAVMPVALRFFSMEDMGCE